MTPWAKRTIGRILPPFVEFLLQIMLDTLKSFEQHPAGNTHRSTSPHIRLFLEALGDEELSITELMQRLCLSNRASFRKTYLQPCLEQRLIEMTLPDKHYRIQFLCK